MLNETSNTPEQRRGERLRTFAYRMIKQQILQGRLNIDSALVEEKLAEALQISRTPVREALAILEHEGFIEAVPYQGLYVRPVTVTEFLEMFETCELIEPELARRAAMNATAADIEAMDAMLTRARACVPDDLIGYSTGCRQFLIKMSECSKQQYMSSVLISLDERADMYMFSKWHSLPLDKMVAAVEDREYILEAIRLRDAEGAAEAARRHARAIQSRWRAHYKSSALAND